MKKLFVKTLMVAGLAGVLSAQPVYNITTIAGSPTVGVGDGGFATLASLVAPVHAVADAAGNVYIADPGVIVSVANCGNSQCVTTGTSPQTLAVTIGVARIRKIDGATGLISTLTTAVTEPRGMALDSAGAFLYVADTGGNRIRKVDTTTGANTTVACNGTAGFSGDGRLATAARCRGPRAVIVDGSNNIWFADSLNNRVRKVTASTGIITTVAGKGPSNSTQAVPSGNANNTQPIPGFPAALTANNIAGDGGPATLAQLANPEGLARDAAGNIYISDTNFNRIREVFAGGGAAGTIATIAGLGTSGGADGVSPNLAQFNAPRGLAFDAAGNLYVADQGNNKIRQIAFTAGVPSGVVRSVAGGGTAGDDKQAASSTLSSPSSVAFDSSGNMLISDQGSAKVRRVDAASGIIGTIAGQTGGRGDNGPALGASLTSPRGVGVGPDGSIYVSDSGNNKVRKINPATGIISLFLGTGAAGDGPASALVGPANGPAPATFSRVNWPGCVVVDSSNNVFVADRVNGKIRKVDSTGIMTTVVNSGNIVPASGTVLPQYQGDGQSALGNNILNTSTGVPGASGTANLNGPNCVAVDNLGNLYVADTSNNVIRLVSNGVITTVVGYQTVNGCPPAAVLGTGGTCVPTVPNNGVPALTGVAGIAGDGGSPANRAQLSAPQGVAVDSTGTQLCIADTQNHIVRQVNVTANTITTIAGIPNDGGSDTIAATTIGWQTRLNLPAGCAFDSSGNVFIADTSNNRIVRVDAATGIISISAGGGTTFASDGKAATTAQLFQPVGIAVDAAGAVYFTDRFGMVKKLTKQ